MQQLLWSSLVDLDLHRPAETSKPSMAGSLSVLVGAQVEQQRILLSGRRFGRTPFVLFLQLSLLFTLDDTVSTFACKQRH